MDKPIDAADVVFSPVTFGDCDSAHLVIYKDYGNTEPRWKRALRWASGGRWFSLIVYSGPCPKADAGGHT